MIFITKALILVRPNKRIIDIRRGLLHVYQIKIKIIQMTSAYPKKLNGLCIGVLSGDRVLFQGPPDKDNGGFKQKILHLTSITAPKLEVSTGNE